MLRLGNTQMIFVVTSWQLNTCKHVIFILLDDVCILLNVELTHRFKYRKKSVTNVTSC